MNKCAIIALAIVATCALAGLASANKVPSHRHRQINNNDDDWELEGGHQSSGHQGHSGHLEHRPRHQQQLQQEDDDDWESGRHGGFRNGGAEHQQHHNTGCSQSECSRRGNQRHHQQEQQHQNQHQNQHQRNHQQEQQLNHNSGKQSSLSGKNSKRTGGSGSGLRRGGSLGGAGIGAAGAVGAAGGFRERDEQSAGLEGRTRLGDHKSIEGHKGFAAGEEKGIKAGHGSRVSNEDEGIRKHQVLNRDKTIIKDRTTGVNDVEGFRRASDKSQGAGFEAHEGKFIGAGAGGSAQSDRDFDHRFAAGEDSEREVEAGGAIGAIGGAGPSF